MDSNIGYIFQNKPNIQQGLHYRTNAPIYLVEYHEATINAREAYSMHTVIFCTVSSGKVRKSDRIWLCGPWFPHISALSAPLRHQRACRVLKGNCFCRCRYMTAMCTGRWPQHALTRRRISPHPGFCSTAQTSAAPQNTSLSILK